MAEIVASAVTIPEDSIEQTSNGLKRRQSEVSEQESKRQRTSPGKNSPAPKEENGTQEQQQSGADKDTSADIDHQSKPATTEHPPASKEPRKRAGRPDEKQRSKRLFGALLGNLNQPGDRTTKRRAEIEQRRKAELQKQDDERVEDRQKRLERLAVQRKKEQIRVDEENLHIRHNNLLNTANYLQTKVEPRLYYRPWDLLPDQEDRIDDQVREAREGIELELAEFQAEKQRRLEDLKLSTGDESTEDTTKKEPAAPESGAEKPEDAVDEQMPTHDTDQQTSNGPANTEDTSKPAEASEPAPPADAETETDANASAEAVHPAAAEESIEGKTEEEDEQGRKDEAEEDGDHVVEGDEDTVVY